MGIYVNPGNELFKRAMNSAIHVDKTGLIDYTNSVLGTEQGYMCISLLAGLENLWRRICWRHITGGNATPEKSFKVEKLPEGRAL